MAFSDDLAKLVVTTLEAKWPTWKSYASSQDGIKLPAFVVTVAAADYHGFSPGAPGVADWGVHVLGVMSRVDVQARITAFGDLIDPGPDGVAAVIEAGLRGQVGNPVVHRAILEAPELTPDGTVAYRWDMTCFGPVTVTP